MSSLHPVGVPVPSHQSAQQFKKDLELAVQRCLPTGRKPYDRMLYAQLMWDNTGSDSAAVLEASNMLAKLFDKVYRSHHHPIVMPSNQGSKAAMRRAIEKLIFMSNQSFGRTLIILHYAGHGRCEKNQLELVSDAHPIHLPDGKRENHYESANFQKIIGGSTELADADVLYIMDCCYSAGAGFDCDRELLAACDVTTDTSAALGGNFTRHVHDALEEMKGMPLTVAQLQGKLFQWYTSTPGGVGLDRLPYHAELHPEMPGSIVLAPLKGPKFETVASDLIATKVVITATLSKTPDVSDISQWQKWLTSNIPAHITNMDIEISGIHYGTSVFVILTLPVSVWAAMRGDPAYCKVPCGPIGGGNALLKAQVSARNQQALAVRPKSPGGLEIVRPRPGPSK